VRQKHGRNRAKRRIRLHKTLTITLQKSKGEGKTDGVRNLTDQTMTRHPEQGVPKRIFVTVRKIATYRTQRSDGVGDTAQPRRQGRQPQRKSSPVDRPGPSMALTSPTTGVSPYPRGGGKKTNEERGGREGRYDTRQTGERPARKAGSRENLDKMPGRYQPTQGDKKKRPAKGRGEERSKVEGTDRNRGHGHADSAGQIKNTEVQAQRAHARKNKYNRQRRGCGGRGGGRQRHKKTSGTGM